MHILFNLHTLTQHTTYRALFRRDMRGPMALSFSLSLSHTHTHINAYTQHKIHTAHDIYSALQRSHARMVGSLVLFLSLSLSLSHTHTHTLTHTHAAKDI